MKRVIAQESFSNNVRDFQAALTKMAGAARIASGAQPFGGSSTVLIEDEDGWNITGVELIEETLSDKSKVYNLRLKFDSFSDPDALAALDKASVSATPARSNKKEGV